MLALREALAAEPGADVEAQAEVGRSLVALGRAGGGRPDGRGAGVVPGRRRPDLSPLAEVPLTVSRRLPRRPGGGRARPGLAALPAAQPAEGLTWLEKARDARAALAESDPSNTTSRSELAASH